MELIQILIPTILVVIDTYTNITACDSLVWNGVSFDYSMSFDGVDDYVDISTSVTNDFTFIAWIYHNQFQNGNNYIFTSPTGNTCNVTNNQTTLLEYKS